MRNRRATPAASDGSGAPASQALFAVLDSSHRHLCSANGVADHRRSRRLRRRETPHRYNTFCPGSPARQHEATHHSGQHQLIWRRHSRKRASGGSARMVQTCVVR